jgi:hypothetical protein
LGLSCALREASEMGHLFACLRRRPRRGCSARRRKETRVRQHGALSDAPDCRIRRGPVGQPVQGSLRLHQSCRTSSQNRMRRRYSCERIRTQLSSSQCAASDLAPVGLLASLAAWLAGATFWCLAGGLLLGAVIPFTLIVILPTNKQLLHPALDKHSGQTGPLLARWADCMPCEASSVLSRCCSCTWRSSGEPFNRGSSHSGFNPADASFKVAAR